MSHAMNGLNGLEGMRNKGIKDRRSFEAFDKGIRHFCGHTLSLYFKVGPVLVQSRVWSRGD
jgi:hypothetical protein